VSPGFCRSFVASWAAPSSAATLDGLRGTAKHESSGGTGLEANKVGAGVALMQMLLLILYSWQVGKTAEA